jgi:putative phosphoesterase
MKIAIISDSHDNLANFKKVISWLKQKRIKILIHCGDICAPLMLKESLGGFSGKVHIVFGNTDGDQYRITKIGYEELSNIIVHGEWGEIKIGEKKIAFVHFPEFARGLAATGKYDLVFYGHTHKPWEERIGKCRLVNPGNVAGLFYKATFAIYDSKTDKLELKILERL